MITLLHVEDDDRYAQVFARFVAGEDVRIARARSAQQAREMSGAPYDGVVVDLALPDSRGAETLRTILSYYPGCPLFVLADTLDDLGDQDLARVRHAAKHDSTAIRQWINNVRAGVRLRAQLDTPRPVRVDQLDYDEEPTGPGSRPTTGQHPIPTEVERKVEAIEKLVSFVRGALWVFGVLGGLFTTALVAAFVWVWTVNADVGRLDAAANRNAERIQEHRRAGGPQGHPASTIQASNQNGERVRALERDVERLEAAFASVDTKLDQVLERLPRRRRRW